MEYTINEYGNKIYCKLEGEPSWDVFVKNGGEFIGTFDNYEYALKAREKALYPNDDIWVWDNLTNN